MPVHWYFDGDCPRLGSKDFGITCKTVEDAENLQIIIDPDFRREWLQVCDVAVVSDVECEIGLKELLRSAGKILRKIDDLNTSIENRRDQDAGGSVDNTVKKWLFEPLRAGKELLKRK